MILTGIDLVETTTELTLHVREVFGGVLNTVGHAVLPMVADQHNSIFHMSNDNAALFSLRGLSVREMSRQSDYVTKTTSRKLHRSMCNMTRVNMVLFARTPG